MNAHRQRHPMFVLYPCFNGYTPSCSYRLCLGEVNGVGVQAHRRTIHEQERCFEKGNWGRQCTPTALMLVSFGRLNVTRFNIQGYS